MVVTPELNKSYKFASNWPNTSSQIYLIERVVNDVETDQNVKIKKVEAGYEITTTVNYPNNQNYEKERIIVDNDYNIKEIYVTDKDNNTVLNLKVSNIDYNAKFNKDYFELNSLITEKKECNDEECKTKETANVLEEIIYPLYVPNETYLESKDTVTNDEGDRHILTFAGKDPFILVEEVSSVNNEMEVVPVNGEPLLLSGTIGALSSNSLSWSINGVDYYLTSSTLDNKEMMTIAESITNSVSVVAKLK